MKKFISNILAVFLTLGISLSLVGCSNDPNDFTVEEHIQRISERIEKSNSHWGYSKGETYEDFEVYPLYNKKDELKYFLVEFAPYGFVFVSVRDEPPIFESFFYANKSMYVVSTDMYGKKQPWTPYTKDKNSPTLPSLIEGCSTERTGEVILDESGNIIIYDKSPYFVTGNVDEKKYLLETDCSYEFICAVKKDGEFINLISGLVLPDSEEYSYENHATLTVRFIASERTDL